MVYHRHAQREFACLVVARKFVTTFAIVRRAEQLIPADPRQRVFHHQVTRFLLCCPYRAGFGRLNSGVGRKRYERKTAAFEASQKESFLQQKLILHLYICQLN